MSKSYKHTPILAIACHTAGEIKQYKKYLHGRRRSQLREQLAHREYELAEAEMPYDMWDDPRDGQQYYTKDKIRPEWMRK